MMGKMEGKKKGRPAAKWIGSVTVVMGVPLEDPKDGIRD